MTFEEAEAAKTEEARGFAKRISLAGDATERGRILAEKHTKPTADPIKRVGIAGIDYFPSSRLRSLNKSTVKDLAKSMSELGMLNPLTVRSRPGNHYGLICGAHRLEAAKLLGWGSVPVIVIDAPKDDLELTQIDENLQRAELTPIERAFHLARAKEIYEAKHPESTARAIQSRHAKELAGKSVEPTGETTPFRHAAAANLGVNPLAVDEAVRFYRIPGVRKAIGTRLDSAPQLRALHKLQKSNPTKVRELINCAAAGESL